MRNYKREDDYDEDTDLVDPAMRRRLARIVALTYIAIAVALIVRCCA